MSSVRVARWLTNQWRGASALTLPQQSMHRPPPLSRPLSSRAGVSYPLQLSSVSESHASLYEESLKHPEQFWDDLASRRLRWTKKFDQVMDCDMRNGQFKWFVGGSLNVSGFSSI